MTGRRVQQHASAHPAFARPGVLAFAALAAGIMASHAAGLGTWHPGALAACAAVAVLALAHPSGLARPIAFSALFLGLGAALGTVPQARTVEGRVLLREVLPSGSPLVAVEGRVAAFPRRSPSGWTVLLGPGVLVEFRGEAVELPGMVALRAGNDPEANRLLLTVVPGDALRAAGPLTPLARSHQRGEFQDWLASRRAVATVRARSAELVPDPEGRSPWRRFLAAGLAAGNEAEARIVRALPEREAALLAAMTLGRTYRLDVEQREAFRRAGLLHLFAVSGLHTMLAGGMMLWLLRLAGFRPGVRLLLLAMLLLFFGALVGFRMSVLRAGLLLLCFESRELLRRPVEPLSALGTVGVALLLLDSASLWQPDFQLTILCAATLVVCAPWIIRMEAGIGRRLGWTWKAALLSTSLRIFLVSAAIQLALMPVLINGFGEVSLIAPVTNVLLLTAAVLCIKLAFLFQFAGVFSSWLAGVLLGVLEWPLRLLDLGSGLLGGLPFAAFSSTPWPVWLGLLYYILLVTGPWNHFHRASHPARPVWRFVPGSLALGLFLLWTPVVLDRGPGAVEVWFLDVGQGDAVLIRAPCGAAALFDAGPPGRGWFLPEMLRQRGVQELDILIASHADADHIGGMPELIRSMPVRRLVVGGSLAPTQIFGDLAEAVREENIPVARAVRGSRLEFGRDRITLEVLHPTEEEAHGDLSRNDASIVLHLRHAGRSVLLPGDAEREAELSMVRSGLPLRADVLMAAHHGSGSSTHELFLNEVRPEFAVISVGRNNRYGHPAPEVLDRLHDAGVRVFRTDHDGSIRLRIHATGRMEWSTAHEPLPLRR